MKQLLFIILAMFSLACASKKEKRKEQKDIVITEKITEEVKEIVTTEEVKTEEKTKDSDVIKEEKYEKDFIEIADSYVKTDPDGTKHEYSNYNKKAKENNASKTSENKKETESTTTTTDTNKDTETKKDIDKKEVDKTTVSESKKTTQNFIFQLAPYLAGVILVVLLIRWQPFRAWIKRLFNK